MEMNVLMAYRLRSSKCLAICLGLTFIMGCFLASLPIQTDYEALPKPIRYGISAQKQTKRNLAIIVPFRDRFEELLEFVPHMFHFLKKQNVPFSIFIIQQKDNNRFNRASLINVGFLYTKKDYDYIAMHDVDLLPLNDNLRYEYPESGPLHISSPQTHPKYHYDTFIGGILLIKKEHFEMVKGMSNNYWGWGLEDDEFYVRLRDAGLTVHRPANINTGIENTFKMEDKVYQQNERKINFLRKLKGWVMLTSKINRHVHDRTYRKRDTRKCFNQREVTRRRDRVTGLHDVSYEIDNTHSVTIDSLPITVINVRLICNKTATPWCQCSEPVKTKKVK